MVLERIFEGLERTLEGISENLREYLRVLGGIGEKWFRDFYQITGIILRAELPKYITLVSKQSSNKLCT